jgi:hypothetical protein
MIVIGEFLDADLFAFTIARYEVTASPAKYGTFAATTPSTTPASWRWPRHSTHLDTCDQNPYGWYHIPYHYRR